MVDAALLNYHQKTFLKGEDLVFEIMMGTIEVVSPGANPAEQTKINIPIGDIPISLEYFNAFFMQEVIEKQITELSFYSFIKLAINSLLVSSLGPECFGDIKFVTSNKIVVKTFNTKNVNKLKRGRTKIEVESNILDRPSLSEKSKEKQILLIYNSKVNFDNNGQINQKEDLKRGIVHFYFGSDRGVIKNIKFTKKDIAFYKEAKILNATENKKGSLFVSEPYDADVTTFGNNIFTPGMKIFIDPRSFGIGGLTDPNYKLVPIGGYYDVISVENIIESGKYETLLKLVYSGIIPETTQ